MFKSQAITNVVSLRHAKLEVPSKILPASPVCSGHADEDGHMLFLAMLLFQSLK